MSYVSTWKYLYRATRRNWWWRWALIPLLAVVAYGAVLGIGFLSDDFLLLYVGLRKGLDFDSLLPNPSGQYYRPVGMLITWELGWQAWGYNPFPYHFISLLAHALAALVLGLWLAEVTSQRSIGWLAGVLFAVFPLHLEVVGWIAAQWDALATLFTILSLWLFTMWWIRRRVWPVYVLSLLFYTLGMFTKESVLTFLPMFALSAWLSTKEYDGSYRGGVARPANGAFRLAYGLLPYLLVLALYMGIRVLVWGYMAGLAKSDISSGEVFWDRLILHARLLLAPVSAVSLGNTTAQLVGVLTSVAILVGLTLYGHNHRYRLFLAGAWIALAIMPVLGLLSSASDLQENRLLYLASAGYCIGVATLLHAAIASAGRWRPLVWSLLSTLILLCIIVCWVHLSVWQVATSQAREVGQELRRLIPPLGHGGYGAVWYVEDMPDNYKGAYVFRLGLSGLRYFTAGELPGIIKVDDAATAPTSDGLSDTFSMRFTYDESDARFHVTYLEGVADADEPPTQQQVGDNLSMWDFRGCSANVTGEWEMLHTGSRCERGKGLLLQPMNEDPQMIGPRVEFDLVSSRARFVRLRVSTRYPPDATSGGSSTWLMQQWYWKNTSSDFSEEHSKPIAIKQDGKSHVYWMLLPVTDKAESITKLRFDPVNGRLPVEVEWIAVDFVR